MQFDLAEVPFSRFGSYMVIDNPPSNRERAAGVYVRTLHSDAPRAGICRIELVRGGQVAAGLAIATPSWLRLENGGDGLDICFADDDILRFRGDGVGLRLSFDFALYDSAMRWRDGWLVNSFSNRMRYALIVGCGAVTCREVDSNWVFECTPDAAGQCEIALIETCLQVPSRDEVFAQEFSACRQMVEREFARWLQAMPTVADEFAAARELAAYVQWSSVVAPRGNFQRQAMLMSKHWFNAVWSWDHCFNAMALSARNPALAWNQFLLPFDHQNTAGALPDCVGDKSIVWNFVKPPIHGLTLSWMLKRSALSLVQLQEIYAPLARWTQWWWSERTTGDGLPQYFHGNDSGWDNASVFAAGVPVQSPDLAAFLILQMDALAEVAQRLEMSGESVEWKQKADALFEKLLTHCWLDNRFVALHARKPCDGDSLLMIMPIILGKRLPKSIQRDLVAALQQENRFLTEHGLASESVASEFYEADGYWRGPIWAPAVFLIVEGLRSIGESNLADDIARRFCRTVARSGMAENFDALTGAGLRDRAHTWTASVFLLLVQSLEDGERK